MSKRLAGAIRFDYTWSRAPRCDAPLLLRPSRCSPMRATTKVAAEESGTVSWAIIERSRTVQRDSRNRVRSPASRCQQ